MMSIRHYHSRLMRDYWLSKLFFDLQQPALAAEFKGNRDAVLARYPLSPEVRKAIADNDAPFLARRTNAYLLRYYFFTIGLKDAEFIRNLRGG
jgi:hypothetical protein